jgi:hypothetical protein
MGRQITAVLWVPISWFTAKARATAAARAFRHTAMDIALSRATIMETHPSA